jgi:LGFP repeat
MTTPIIDYNFNQPHVSNPDGTLPINLDPSVIQSLAPDPVLINGVEYDGALNTNALTAPLSINISSVTKIDSSRFHVQVVFFLNAELTGTQNIVQCSRLPFSLALTLDGDQSVITASVKSRTVSWRATETYSSPAIDSGSWHSADLVYDVDTLAVFLDGKFVSLHGFGSENSIGLLSAGAFTIGGTDSATRFKGLIAAVKFNAGIPADLESKLDPQRISAQWFITTKLETLRPKFDIGNPTSIPTVDSGGFMWAQSYDRGVIMFDSSSATAFEMHGPIYERYLRMEDPTSSLGYLASDTEPTGDPTDPDSVVSTFAYGAIYYSPTQNGRLGAVEVIGRIYVEYKISDGPKVTGVPLLIPVEIDNGVLQIMSRASWMSKTESGTAHFVAGAIRDAYQTSGGWNTWGYPITNEVDVQIQGETRPMKLSRFEKCTFYWSEATGAHWVRGDIEAKYNEVGGPTNLGLPVSDEVDIPGTPNGKMSSFENGVICWFGSLEDTKIARPFHFYLATIDTVENEGFGMGQNDVYLSGISIKENDTYLLNARYPDDGDSDDHNIWSPEVSFPPLLVPRIGVTYKIVMDIYDADPGNDDYLGTWSKTLDATNAWGFADHDGIWRSGPFQSINSVLASAKPVIDVSTIPENINFWGSREEAPDNPKSTNFATARISRSEFAEAFPSVDSDPEWYDILDGIDSIFYELAVANIADTGNCVGLCLESAYARQSRSPFSLPLNQYTIWPDLERTMNVKMQYQVGAQSIWWFLSQVLSGSMHNPKDVFTNALESFQAGKLPLLCFTETYWFGGTVHTVQPMEWDNSTWPWTIKVHDPNWAPADEYDNRNVIVDPIGDINSFKYQLFDDTQLEGGRWSGSRMWYMDMDILGNAPRVPTWDAISLIVSGVMVVSGDGVATKSIQDPKGQDLDGTSDAATARLQQGQDLNGYFIPFPLASGFAGGVRGQGPQILLSGTPGRLKGKGTEESRELYNIANLSKRVVDLAGAGFHSLISSSVIQEHPDDEGTVCKQDDDRGELYREHSTPLPGHLADFGQLPTFPQRGQLDVISIQGPLNSLCPTGTTPLGQGQFGDSTSRHPSFIHTITGTGRLSPLAYFAKSTLSRFELRNGTITNSEILKVHVRGVGDASGYYELDLDRPKDFSFRMSQRHGLTAGGLSLEVSLVTAKKGSLRITSPPGLFVVDLVPSYKGLVVKAKATIKAAWMSGWSSQDIDLSELFGPGGVRLKICPFLVGKNVTVATLGGGGIVLHSTVVEAPLPPH